MKRGSITTTKPNEAWHLDATIVRALDGAKAIVQFVMDNFSRKILAFRIMHALSAATTVDLLQEARVVSGIAEQIEVTLVTDGGPENDNDLVTTYTTTSSIKHLIAHVSISCSNSMIEAANKTLKYRHIFPKAVTTEPVLYRVVPDAITEYNARPFASLSGLCPNESYAGKVFDKESYRADLARARAQRLAENRAACPPCRPLTLGEEQTTTSDTTKASSEVAR